MMISPRGGAGYLLGRLRASDALQLDRQDLWMASEGNWPLDAHPDGALHPDAEPSAIDPTVANREYHPGLDLLHFLLPFVPALADHPGAPAASPALSREYRREWVPCHGPPRGKTGSWDNLTGQADG